MKDLRAVLAEADPLREEAPLPASDVQFMRRAMLGAVETPSPLAIPRAVPVAALVVVMIVAGVAAGRRFSTGAPAGADTEALVLQPAGGERRQVQFATPGGTRIIWTIDPDFQMRGTLP